MDYRQYKRRGAKIQGDHKLSQTELNHKHQDKLASIDNQFNDAVSNINWDRRNAAEKDIVLWVNTYCLNVFLDDSPPPLGEEILKEMYRAITDPTSRPYMVCQSRGSGKTSYIECVTMYALATGKKKFIVVIGHNATSAESILNDIVRIVMDSDTPFAQDYPELTLPFQLCNGAYRRRQIYNSVSTEIVKNINRICFARLKKDDGTEFPTSGSCIYTRGITSGLRGLKKNTLRPDCVLLDDIQSSEQANSQEQVEKLLEIINKDVFNLSGKGKIQVLQTGTPICADDLVERIIQDQHWKTTKFPAIIQFPDDIEKNPDNGFWYKYFTMYDAENAKDGSHEKSLKYYKRHQKKMDKGAVVLNPKRYLESDGHISALQALLEKKHLIGDSAFYSEYQMEPKRITLSLNILPKNVVANINNQYNRCIVPDGFIFTCATLDLNTSYGGTCIIKSYKTDSTSVVLFHKVYRMNIDQQLNQIQYNQAVYNQLSIIGKDLMELGVKIDALGIDGGGRNITAVCEFSKNCFRLYGIPACCMIGRASTNYNPLVRSRLRNAIGQTVLCGDEKEHIKNGAGSKWMFFNSDYYKELEQRSLLTEPGSIGGMSLYDDLPLNHIEFANQVCNEKIKWKKVLSNGRTEYSWISKEPHDYLDCLAMSRAIAESQGLASSVITKIVQNTPMTSIHNNNNVSKFRKRISLMKYKRVRIV